MSQISNDKVLQTMAYLNAGVANILESDREGYASSDVLSSVADISAMVIVAGREGKAKVMAQGLMRMSALCAVCLMSNDGLIDSLG